MISNIPGEVLHDDYKKIQLVLEMIVGNEEEVTESWYTGYNRSLRGVPREIMKTEEGRREVLSYLMSRTAMWGR